MRRNLDRRLWRSSTLFCGVDEVGRGALAGPVVAAAVILPQGCLIRGADDSKQLTERQRRQVAARVQARAISIGIGATSARQIDRHNIRQATFQAMRHAVGRLTPVPELALVDGEELTGTACPSRGIVRGDSRSLSIACASVVAKVFRDRLMRKLAGRFPGYALERNVGYGTPAHLAALHSLGPCPLHRRSFAPVARMALGLTA